MFACECVHASMCGVSLCSVWVGSAHIREPVLCKCGNLFVFSNSFLLFLVSCNEVCEKCEEEGLGVSCIHVMAVARVMGGKSRT